MRMPMSAPVTVLPCNQFDRFYPGDGGLSAPYASASAS
jgi:hypothetical protein